ncbi:MAG: serine hydrolase family protein [Gemmatimonadetes bacterium]|nr:serine hydrolase family protein [Gemmatimonadota bacterium]
MGRLTESSLRVQRTGRVVSLGAEVTAPRECWIVLHGYRQLADRFLRRFATLDDGTRRIVAPEALNRFYVDEDGGPHGPEHRVGASWMTRHRREDDIADYVHYLDRVAAVESERFSPATRLVVLGFSQGVHTAVRWVVRSQRPAPHTLVLWGAGPPGDVEPARARARLTSTRVVTVHGRTDRHRSPEGDRAAAERIAEWGVEPELVEHPGGHRIDPTCLERMVAP